MFFYYNFFQFSCVFFFVMLIIEIECIIKYKVFDKGLWVWFYKTNNFVKNLDSDKNVHD